MNRRFIISIVSSALTFAAAHAPAQLFQFTTLAGSAGTNGAADGTGPAAQFYQPQAVAVDASGNLFVADTANDTIREITSGGVVSTFAGTASVAGFTNASGTNAVFNAPQSLAHDSAGNWFVADTANNVIRKITPAGVVTTIAGLPGFSGDTDGTDSLVYTNNGARLNRPAGLAVDAAGNIFVADSGNHTIREISPAGTNWVVSTIAGYAGSPGSADGSGIAAQFLHPAGLAVDAAGHLILADGGNSTVRVGSIITNTPLVFLPQPQSQTVNQSSNATFTVSLSGATNVYFQWYFNGAAISGANSNSFTLAAAQPADAGNYFVQVITPTGTAMSSNAVLTVNPPPQFIVQPAPRVCALGGSATFTVPAMTEPLVYQ